MEKIFYIEYVDKNESIGVNNKINAQCNEFSKHYETILIYPEGNNICINYFNKTEVKQIKNGLGTRRLRSKSILSKIYKIVRIIKFNMAIRKLLIEENPKIIYIRKYNILNGVKILKNFKKKNDAYVIYEIPTYPYDQEFKKKRKYLRYIFNKKIDKGMEKFSDIIPVVLGKDVKFNCKKYIPIFNGIDIKIINLKTKNTLKKNEINLVGIASLSFWHGYDRVIEGLKNYYSRGFKIKVIFNIVGEGDELDNLKELVQKYKLNDYVVFHGTQKGKELDHIVDYCDIGIGSIANHRKGLTKDSSLKNREYCARGIPFVIASKDDVFENFKYTYEIPRNEIPVNINDVIHFYNNIKNDDYINKMRKYAESKLTWEATMKPIVDEIDKNNMKNIQAISE